MTLRDIAELIFLAMNLLIGYRWGVADERRRQGRAP
jgi:hypothetical protein